MAGPASKCRGNNLHLPCRLHCPPAGESSASAWPASTLAGSPAPRQYYRSLPLATATGARIASCSVLRPQGLPSRSDTRCPRPEARAYRRRRKTRFWEGATFRWMTPGPVHPRRRGGRKGSAGCIVHGYRKMRREPKWIGFRTATRKYEHVTTLIVISHYRYPYRFLAARQEQPEGSRILLKHH